MGRRSYADPAADWIDALREATDELMADPATPGMDFAAGNGPRFFTLTYAWRYHRRSADWALRGRLIELSGRCAGGAVADPFFFDQIFAREAGATKTTRSTRTSPIARRRAFDHFFRNWVPLEVVTTDSGAVRYLRGSHRGPTYRARSFDEANAVASLYDNAEYFEELPDFAASYDSYDWLVGAVERAT